jgi:hypothetical protein
MKGGYMLHVSLYELITMGKLGPITLGMPSCIVRDHLGLSAYDNDGYNISSKYRRHGMIWKYGDIELFFEEHNDLYMIFLENFDIPQGGSSFQLDPWIIQRDLSWGTAQAALYAAHIPYRRVENNLGNLWLEIGIGARLIFDESGEELYVLSYSLAEPFRSYAYLSSL